MAGYTSSRAKKREMKREIDLIHEQSRKRSVWHHLRGMTSLLRHLSQQSQLVRKAREQSLRQKIVQEWHLASLEFKRARLFRESNLKRVYFGQLQESILIQQIRRQKKIRGLRFRESNLKYKFL